MGGPAGTRYDPLGGGGNVTLDYDERRQRLVQDYISLNGTIVNCAGGIGFGFSGWLTCEETTAGVPPWGQPHGYVFEVPLNVEPGELRKPQPIKAMGRFAHEALAVDQETGIVYLTEDGGSGAGSGFYRFLPNQRRNLLAGGRLQMLGIVRAPKADLREGQRVGQELRVQWFDIADPDPAIPAPSSSTSTFNQGFGQGGAKFNRLEGCWFDDGHIFFVSTSGGDAKNGDVNADGFREGYGQVWRFEPEDDGEGGELELVFESPGVDVLDSPDNLTVTPRGGLILGEDDAGSGDGDTHPLAPGITDVNRLIGLSRHGEAFEFAVNLLNDTEFRGPASAPRGRRCSPTSSGMGHRAAA